VLARLRTSRTGLTSSEAAHRLALFGPNALHGHVVGPLDVLAGQLKNPLLLLLAATAAISLVLQDQTDAIIILGIVILSVGLGFINEYRSVRAIADLHAQVRHTARTSRDDALVTVDVTALVPGDIVALDVGDVVPADLRLLDSQHLACDEAVLTGESMPAEKTAGALAEGASLNLPSCALMGTVIRAGTGRGIVVRTGSSTELGKIASRLGGRMPETAFQQGLRAFSGLLVWITAIVTTVVFVVNAIVRHSPLESLLFALAIAVSLTPQLLPAIVTISLATGARRMARRSVLVKRLVSIEDLGNMTVLSTAVGSLILPFLPLLPSQILLNNLLYDFSEMTTPTDNVDEELLHRPAHWDMGLIRRFMFVFGPISSLFDFSIFAVMLLAFHAGATLFRSGYFLESFITQTLVIFAIRTHRVPFFRSRASWQLATTTIGVAIVGASLPFLPFGSFFGFTPLPPTFFGVLTGLMLVYILLIEFAKTRLFRAAASGPKKRPEGPSRGHRRLVRVLAHWPQPPRQGQLLGHRDDSPQ
jgi:magnesium-transporting ATPase (P-type)